MSLERLNKVLAALGYGSRRRVDAMIVKRRISVNGQTAKLGSKVLPTDTITLDNRPIIRRPQQKIVVAFNKPVGVTTTRKDRFAKVTVMDFLPPDLQHLYPVGRLDKNSRGLLLLTNDGDLAQKLEHPRHGHQKEYDVVVKPKQSHHSAERFNQDMNRLSHQIINPNHQTKPVTITRHHFDNQSQTGTVTLVLTEGKKRQIRELMDELNYRVIDLCRSRINNLSLASLPEGKYSIIDPQTVQ